MPTLNKVCIICKVEKAETEFYPNRYTKQDGSKGKRQDCAECCKKRRAEYFKVPEKRNKINDCYLVKDFDSLVTAARKRLHILKYLKRELKKITT